MRIGVVTTSYPRREGEAAGNFVAELSQWIEGCGHRVEVVAAGDPGQDESWQKLPVSRVSAAPGLFYEGGAPDKLRSKTRLLQALAFQAKLAREVRPRAAEWDAIVAHWLVPGALAAVLAAGKMPVTAIAHGGDVYLLQRLGLTALVARLLDRPNVKLRFVSHSLQEVFARNAGAAGANLIARSTVSSMGIDLDRFRALRAKRKENETPVLLFLGRLVPIKGLDTFIDALSGLERECQVIISGRGPMEERRKQRASEHGLPLQWVGEVGGDERDALLSRADVVVMPSRTHGGRREGMPLVALEALASGAQLLASTSGGLAEIPSSLCHQVAPEDPRALRGQLRDILDGKIRSASPDAWLAARDWSRLAPTLLPELN